MPNAILTKHDGRNCNIPAGSAIAFLSCALDAPDPERPDLRSTVMTNFRGLSSYLLAHTAQEAFDEIEKARSKKGALKMLARGPQWIALSCGGDVTRIPSGSAPAYEQMNFKAADGSDDPRLRVHVMIPAAEKFITLDVDDTPDNMAALDADIEKTGA